MILNISVQISFVTLLITEAVFCLRQVKESRRVQKPDSLLLSKIISVLQNNSQLNDDVIYKDRTFYNTLLSDLNLRRAVDIDPQDLQDNQAQLIEHELKSALAHKKSALFDKPYVLNQGKNDYLVMRPDYMDPFVTIVPNAIFYNIEKKCVNWLDDCNLEGIRSRLLKGVRSPYKK